jgi:hypothetical protein
MGYFGKTVFCLVDFSETLLAHPMIKLLFVGVKNSLSESSCLLIQKLIKFSLEYNYYFEKKLYASENGA